MTLSTQRCRLGRLLEGVDELGYILKQDAAISAYEANRVGSVNTLA